MPTCELLQAAEFAKRSLSDKATPFNWLEIYARPLGAI